MTTTYEYDPFGRLLYAEPPPAYETAPQFLFSTKLYESHWHHYYYGYRYYSPDLGRWLSRDPMGEDDGPNVHGFVRNSPVNHLDVLGESAWTPNAWNVFQREARRTFRWLDELEQRQERAQYSGGGTAPAFFHHLINATANVKGEVNRQVLSLPIASFGAVTVKLAAFMFGRAEECCTESGRSGHMFSGGFRVEVSAGVGYSVGLDSMRAVIGVGGKLPPCKTTIQDLVFKLRVHARTGAGTVFEAGQEIAECSAKMSCKWAYTTPPTVRMSSGGIALEVAVV